MEAQQILIHGRPVGYRAAGTGPVVALIHGMAGSSETWEPLIDTLAEHATVIAPDLPGHGSSAKPRGDYSLGSLASSVRDLLVALGHDRATIVGHSLGGGVAMQFSYQFPERSERLVLVASGGLGPEVHPLLRALSFPGAEYVLSIGCAPRVRRAGETLGGWLHKTGLRATPAAAEMWRSYSALGDAETRAAFVRTLRAVIDASGQSVSASDRLYLTAHIPTLVVWGERDKIIPVSHARTAHEAMPGSRLEIFPSAGHFVHRDVPRSFGALLSDFVRSTEPARLSASQALRAPD